MAPTNLRLMTLPPEDVQVDDYAKKSVAAGSRRFEWSTVEQAFLDQAPALYRFLRARTRNSADAEDLVQQVFFKVFQGHSAFVGSRDSLAGWFFRIARNASIDWVRRRRSESSWEDLISTGLVFSSPDRSPEDAVLLHEQLEMLADAVATLSAEQQDLLHLRYAAGLTLVEIASILDITDVAARQRLRRILTQLRGMTNDPTR